MKPIVAKIISNLKKIISNVIKKRLLIISSELEAFSRTSITHSSPTNNIAITTTPFFTPQAGQENKVTAPIFNDKN